MRPLPKLPMNWFAARKGIVVSGSNDAAVQTIVNAINNLLGNYGSLDMAQPAFTLKVVLMLRWMPWLLMNAGKVGPSDSWSEPKPLFLRCCR